MEGLTAEVSDLSRRNDELMTYQDSDLIVIRDRDARLKEYSTKPSMSRPRRISAQPKVCMLIPSFLPFARFSRSNCSYFGSFPARKCNIRTTCAPVPGWCMCSVCVTHSHCRSGERDMTVSFSSTTRFLRNVTPRH